jgi:dipeptidyl aminopeptidase/acylaminoacyl peptidase
MGRGVRQGMAAFAACAAVVSILPAMASAVVPGTNGTISFTSGRGAGGDASADIYLLNFPNTGDIDPLTSATGQHRHPSWSPDRTKIVYALWNGADKDLWIHTLPGTSRSRLTLDAEEEDRPAWSPDGTKIAYEVTNGGAGTQEDIEVANAVTLGGDTAVDITQDSAATEGKPAWSADSQSVFYSSDAAGAPVDNNIVREPAGGGAVTNVITGATDDYQPAISPDGQRMCFTRGAFGSNDAEIFTANANGLNSGVAPLSPDDNVGSYNCAWSPDGEKILYVTGTFSNGALMMENSDNTGLPQTLTNEAAVFDGNPDWAPDGRPTCDDTTVNARSSNAEEIALSCLDTGPDYERTAVTEQITAGSGPQHGTLGELQQGEPATVSYTGDPNFVGTDTFRFSGDDARGPSANQGTVTINVTDGTDPVLELSGKKKQNLKKFVKVNASCDESCSVEAEGKLKVKKGKLKQDTADIGAGQTATLKLKIKKKALQGAEEKLDKGKKVKANLSATATDGAGNTADASFKTKLK